MKLLTLILLVIIILKEVFVKQTNELTYLLRKYNKFTLSRKVKIKSICEIIMVELKKGSEIVAFTIKFFKSKY